MTPRHACERRAQRRPGCHRAAVHSTTKRRPSSESARLSHSAQHLLGCCGPHSGRTQRGRAACAVCGGLSGCLCRSIVVSRGIGAGLGCLAAAISGCRWRDRGAGGGWSGGALVVVDIGPDGHAPDGRSAHLFQVLDSQLVRGTVGVGDDHLDKVGVRGTKGALGAPNPHSSSPSITNRGEGGASGGRGAWGWRTAGGAGAQPRALRCGTRGLRKGGGKSAPAASLTA